LRFIIAFVTAVGGGTLRIMIVVRQWDGCKTSMLYVIAFAFALSILFRQKNLINFAPLLYILFDTIGLGVLP
jgi:uncharacterized membrane protein YeiH